MRHLKLALLLPLLSSTHATNPRPYPLPDAHLQTTSILNHSSYLSANNLDDPQWYLDNIPFIDVPDPLLQSVYYYRASVIKRHIKWAHEGHGWVVTEFIHPVTWASKFQTIPDSAGHHISELRWLRDPNYVKNLIESYTRGGVEALSGISYTHYIQRAILEHAQVTGDASFLTSQLDGMIASYNLWNSTRDNTTGLYHRTPLSDAQEYSLPGYLTGGPEGGPMQEWNDFGLSATGVNDYDVIWLGPETYRPSFNAYMVANAWAIGEVAALAGDPALAQTWTDYGNDLYTKMESLLYSSELNFWIDVVEGTNLRCEGRELIGYFPYRFGLGASNQTQIAGLAAGLDTEHFLTDFGPTTLEQVNPYYTALKNTTYCCMWQGQSWPFSTSVYLHTLAYIARDGSINNSVITAELLNQEFDKYTRTNTKDGQPYTAESHYPTIDMWSGDTSNHSENYLHSTYLDNLFTDILGIVPSLGDQLVLQPLVPGNWSYFAVESLPYHGTLLSFVWDEDGTHYSLNNGSAGLSIYSNGTLFYHQAALGPVNVTLPFNSTKAAQRLADQTEWQNILANPNSPWNLPSITADWALDTNGDNTIPYQAYKLNDGLLWYDTTPDNRWTNNQSEIPYSTLAITLPRARNLSSISLAIFADVDRGGVADCPAGVKVVDGNTGTVVAYENPWSGCVPNALNTLSFSDVVAGNSTSDDSSSSGSEDGSFSVETDYLQVTLSDKLGYTTAVTEIQLWVPPQTGPRYEAEDGVIGTFIGGFQGRASGLNGTIVDGGVSLGSSGWVELAGVRSLDGEAAQNASLTVVGGGSGSVEVLVNWLGKQTVTFSGDGNQSETVAVDLLRGGNVVTLSQTGGTPWVDAVVVG